MCLLLETIRIEHGIICHGDYHVKRMQRSIGMLFGKTTDPGILDNINIPRDYSHGIARCRVLYKTTIEKTEFSNYNPRPVTSLKLVDGGDISYPHKFADRRNIEDLYQRREQCDDILIVRNGFVTDTSIANVIFYDGLRWFTPALPLLQGTMRQQLLDQGLIHEKEIPLSDLRLYKKVMLINAFRNFDEASAFPSASIF